MAAGLGPNVGLGKNPECENNLSNSPKSSNRRELQKFLHALATRGIESNIKNQGFQIADWILIQGLAFSSRQDIPDDLVMTILELTQPKTAQKFRRDPSIIWTAKMKSDFETLREKIRKARQNLSFEQANRLKPGFYVASSPAQIAHYGSQLAIVEVYEKTVPGATEIPLFNMISEDSFAADNYHAIHDARIIRGMRHPEIQDLWEAVDFLRISPAERGAWERENMLPSSYVHLRLFLNSPKISATDLIAAYPKLPTETQKLLRLMKAGLGGRENDSQFKVAYKKTESLRKHLGISRI